MKQFRMLATLGLSRYISASVEATLDALPAADGAVLAEASGSAKDLHDRLVKDANNLTLSDAYLAGRLETLAEILGLAAARRGISSMT